MATMSLARQIRVQKLQTKNRMVGQTFNPSGITSEQIREREERFVLEFREKPLGERQEYWRNIQEWLKYKRENNIFCSNAWEWNCFERNFVFQDEVF